MRVNEKKVKIHENKSNKTEEDDKRRNRWKYATLNDNG